jgi:2-methylisocitrate lyase-like PEP mutase family enzyme
MTGPSTSRDLLITKCDVARISTMQLYDGVCAMERAGVSGVVLECTTDPTRRDSGGVQKIARLIEVLVSVRWTPDFVIAARVACMEKSSLSNLAECLNECASAGADLLFIDNSIATPVMAALTHIAEKPLCVDLSGLPQQAVVPVRSLVRDLQGAGVAAAVVPSIQKWNRPSSFEDLRLIQAGAASGFPCRNWLDRGVTHLARRSRAFSALRS